MPVWSRLSRSAPDEATAFQLSDPAYANDQEVAAMHALYGRNQQCAQTALAALSSTAPGMIPIASSYFTNSFQNADLLEQRKITWGEFNTRQAVLFRQILAEIGG